MVDWHHFVGELGQVETPQGAAIAFRGSPGFMDAANVRFIVSMAPLSDPALREVHRGSALVYENTRALPRAYLVPAVARTAPGAELRAMESGWGSAPNRVRGLHGPHHAPGPSASPRPSRGHLRICQRVCTRSAGSPP
jgi:hypothetical protein